MDLCVCLSSPGEVRAAEWICSVCVFPALVDPELFQGRRNMIQDSEQGRRSGKHLGRSHLWLCCELIRVCPVLGVD